MEHIMWGQRLLIVVKELRQETVLLKFLLCNEAEASKAVFVIVSRSDGWAEMLSEPLNNSKTVCDRPHRELIGTYWLAFFQMGPSPTSNPP